VRFDSFTREKWLEFIHMWDGAARYPRVRDFWFVFFIHHHACVPWLIRMWDVNHS